MNVYEYMESLETNDWEKIVVRNTFKGKFNWEYHFPRVFTWDKSIFTVSRVWIK